MRKITHLVVHCSATRANSDIGAREITLMHKKRGFRTIGYHYVIRRDGTVETGRKLEEAGAHVEGHNRNAVGICLVGGLDAANRPQFNYTEAQLVSLRNLLTKLLQDLQSIFGDSYVPPDILGHRDFPKVAKACPCFNVREWWAMVNVNGESNATNKRNFEE